MMAPNIISRYTPLVAISSVGHSNVSAKGEKRIPIMTPNPTVMQSAKVRLRTPAMKSSLSKIARPYDAPIMGPINRESNEPAMM